MTDDLVALHLKRSLATLTAAVEDDGFRATITAIAARIATAFRAGNKVLLAGNGGSAADAQHIAGEFLSRFRFDRNPLPAIALTVDTSVLTAIGNDYGYERVFERQIQGLGRAGDVFIAISTSGRSPNVLAAMKAARALGVATVAFTGTAPGAAAMRELADLFLAAPTPDTPLMQQLHIVAAHAICELVEHDLFGRKG
jgi:D-sedoheptulose 7-phosphate isomerase